MRRMMFASALCSLLAACGGNTTRVAVEQPKEGMQVQYNTGMPVGDVMDEKNGKETWLGVGALMGVNGTNANGVAFGHGFENGSYMFTGQLNIAIAEDGTFYQAWLKNEDTGDIIEAGRPQPIAGDVRHGLRLESKKDLTGYRTVLITLEQDDGDPSMGSIVAQGTLKEQKRNR